MCGAPCGLNGTSGNAIPLTLSSVSSSLTSCSVYHYIMKALLLSSILGLAVSVGLALNADASLSIMGLDSSSDPALISMSRDFLMVR